MMQDYILTLDLGTTNIKAGIYDRNLHEVGIASFGVEYSYDNGCVEFEPEQYWALCMRCIREVLNTSNTDSRNVRTLALTGQAESLVIVDDRGRPLRKGISWMDDRSGAECETLKHAFDSAMGYPITGQPDIVTTWPITKILWLRSHEGDVFDQAYKYLLLKDFIIYKLTGCFRGDLTIYNFSYYLDITTKSYWHDILEYVGVRIEQLPELIEPGEPAGTVRKAIADEFGFPPDVSVNVGALDHFAGMIGSGNVREGMVSETTGTVLAAATMVARPVINEYKIPCHYHAIRDTYVLLPVCESGGICLEWARNTFFPGISFDELNEEAGKTIGTGNDLIFLPYLTGTNSPEFDSTARGVFYGITMRHTRGDFVRAVMEGVAYLLRKNIACLEKLDISVEDIRSLGGGAKSAVWNQMKADITGKNILIPAYEEATSLGAALLAGVACGYYTSVEEAVEKTVRIQKTYRPVTREYYAEGYDTFLQIYQQLVPVFHRSHSAR